MQRWLVAMMKQPTVRPARAAIAAVLAFAPTSLLAQELAPAGPPPVTVTQTAPPPVVAAPPAVAPTAAPAPVMAAPAPVVQSAPAPVIAEAAPEAPQPRAERQAPTRAAPAASRAVVAPQSVAAPSAEVTPTQATPPTSIVSVEPVRDTAPVDTAPVLPASAETGDGLEWGLAGGALVLVAGVGLMAMRRRRRKDGTAMLSDPVRSTQPLVRADDQVAYVPERQPTLALTPTMASSTVRKSNATHGSLESMAEESPSRENPFLTRKNRLRRAHFLLRQEHAPSTSAASVEAVAAQTQNDRRQSVTYDFGKASMSQRRGFRPATT